jgi:hypothetical protein
MTPLIHKIIGLVAASLLVGICVAPVYYFGPGGDGVLDHLTWEDGSEFVVAQRYNGDFGEPYSVDFFVRQPGSAWGWCYIEHEDTRWTRGQLRHNPQNRTIEVYRGFWLVAAYTLDRQTFILYSRGDRESFRPARNYRDPPVRKT